MPRLTLKDTAAIVEQSLWLTQALQLYGLRLTLPGHGCKHGLPEELLKPRLRLIWHLHDAPRARCTCRQGPCDASQVYRQYGLPRMSALRATLRREITLIRRTSFIYIFRTFQVGCAARFHRFAYPHPHSHIATQPTW